MLQLILISVISIIDLLFLITIFIKLGKKREV